MENVQFKLSMPADLKEWFKSLAKQNLRSTSSEMILALREKMEASASKK